MSGARVSVVVPTFDRAGFVETAIESALSQDYESLDVVVVDDGSTDDTPAVLARIAQRHGPQRFRHLRQDNAGQATAVNRGLAEAGGDLLCILNSDDAMLPGAISRLVAAADEHEDVEVFYPRFEMIDAQDRVIDSFTHIQHTFVEALAWGLCLPGPATLVRRRAYDRIGGWDASFRTAPDFEWFLRAHDATFLVVPEVLAVWRRHPGSITTSQLDLEAVAERLRLLDGLFARDDLPPEAHEVKLHAYANTLIQCGVMIAGDYIGTAESRYSIEDRMGPVLSRASFHATTQSYQLLERRLRLLGLRLQRREETADQDRATIALLREENGLHLAGIQALEAQLAQAQTVPAARPLWLRAARRATPPSLRPRLGATLHRIRRAG
jgi:glycosyltransferase involved in cell wall biosynthesis